MNKTYFLATLAAAAFFAAIPPAPAAEIQCAGVLGNSGEQGPDLVRFGAKPALGLGVVADAAGTLWDRGGDGVLNRYSLDGRLLASYKLPSLPPQSGDSLVEINGTLLLCLNGQLYTLPMDAPAGTEAKPLNVQVGRISPTHRDGWVVGLRRKNLPAPNPPVQEVVLLNLAGEEKPLHTVKDIHALWIYSAAFNAEGKPVFFFNNRKAYTLADPANPVALPPEDTLYASALEGLAPAGANPGDRPVFIDGYWYGSGNHSTVYRFDASLSPAPGVVLGGNSGAFIGHVDEQAEVVGPTGIAKLRPGLFAVAGREGIMHLMDWSANEQRMIPFRRIGAMRDCAALSLDSQGRIWWLAGNWNWADGPDTPLHYGIPQPEISAQAVLANDTVIAYGLMWNLPSLFFGPMEKELRCIRLDERTAPGVAKQLPVKEVAGAAVVDQQLQGKAAKLLLLTKTGAIHAIEIGAGGEYRKLGEPVEWQLESPVKEWTSLATLGTDKLFAAGDGSVIELERAGDWKWKETRRWNSWGTGDESRLGSPASGEKINPVRLAIADGKLWVADTANHRVLCMDAAAFGKVLATFGTQGQPGDTLAALNAPTTLSASGKRAVVYDSGNQRLMKLELKE